MEFDYYAERARYEAEEDGSLEDEELPTCYICGELCGNPQGRHYECAVMEGEDLDRTFGFGDLGHVW